MRAISKNMNFGRRLIVGALAIAAALGLLMAIALDRSAPQSAASASSLTALQLADKALAMNTLLDDEGQYRLIDPIGPGGISRLAARNEVIAPRMIGGQYSGYNSVRDPFEPSGGDSYPPVPYGFPQGQLP
jgi:hypothetical protein